MADAVWCPASLWLAGESIVSGSDSDLEDPFRVDTGASSRSPGSSSVSDGTTRSSGGDVADGALFGGSNTESAGRGTYSTLMSRDLAVLLTVASVVTVIVVVASVSVARHRRRSHRRGSRRVTQAEDVFNSGSRAGRERSLLDVVSPAVKDAAFPLRARGTTISDGAYTVFDPRTNAAASLHRVRRPLPQTDAQQAAVSSERGVRGDAGRSIESESVALASPRVRRGGVRKIKKVRRARHVARDASTQPQVTPSGPRTPGSA